MRSWKIIILFLLFLCVFEIVPSKAVRCVCVRRLWQFGFPRKWTLRWTLRCRMLIRESPWHQPLWKGGRRAGLGRGRPGSSLRALTPRERWSWTHLQSCTSFLLLLGQIPPNLLPPTTAHLFSYSLRDQKSKIQVLTELRSFWRLQG